MRYDWTRFWCRNSESFELDFDGFLVDPEAEHGGARNPSVHKLATLDNTPCLILLGEPGIGKTTALAENSRGATSDESLPTSEKLSIDLASFGSETRLISAVFESDAAKAWLTGQHHLSVWLDSLDECRLQLEHIAKLLAEQLEAWRPQLRRLSLRVACRTAEWPRLLTEKFHDLWGEDAVGIYELLPLRRRDVLAAASGNGFDADDFLQEVIRADAQSLAMKPVTLDFLLRQFRNQGSLSASQKDLYENGCRLLVQEENLSRQGAGQRGVLDPAERLRAAELIAAMTMFCNKQAVCLEAMSVPESDDVLSLLEIRSAFDTADAAVAYTEEQIRDTLSTGLFSGRGESRVGFAHRTYTEFLAASYIAKSELNAAERLKLIRHADDSNGKTVPQLAEVAAWLASYDREVFDDLLRTDPQVLVRSDCADLSSEKKQELVARLLKLAEQGELLYQDWGHRDHYHTLNYSGIADQLRPVVVDVTQDEAARELAFTIAEECRVTELEQDIVAVALNVDDDERSRYLAARAVLIGGGEEARVALKPLGIGPPQHDSELRIRALVLGRLWPEHITCEELFASLRVPENDRGGSYGFFLSHELPRTLNTEHLPRALEWASQLSETERQEYSVRRLVAAIAEQAWGELNEHAVFEAFVKYSLAILKTHSDILADGSKMDQNDEPCRRALLADVVPAIEDFDRQGYGLIFKKPSLARTSDAAWMIEKLRDEVSPNTRQHWAKLIERLFVSSEPGLLDKVLDACDWCEELRAVFADRFDAIRLDSDRAWELRELHAQHMKWERERQEQENPPPLDPPPEERVLRALDASEAGEAAVWYYASRDLQLKNNSTHYEGDLEVDITKTPGWQGSDQPTRRRLIEAAERFLLKCDPRSEEWLGTNRMLFHALWGYKALVLLRKEDSSALHGLPDSVWGVWAPMIVTYLDHGGDKLDKPIHDEFAQTCSALAPGEVNDALRTIIRKSEGTFIPPQFLDRAWSVDIESCLCEEASRPETAPNVVGRLLDVLLKHNSSNAESIAKAIVHDSGHEQSEARLEAAAALLSHTPSDSWDMLWETIQSDNGFGKALFLRHADSHMHNPVLACQLAEQKVADLYIWLEKNFPRATDPEHDGPHCVSPRDAVKEYRDASLRTLQHRGTGAAIASLELIRDALPHLEWMPRVIADARRIRLRESWIPLSASELIALSSRSNACLVRSAHNLQEVVLESLGILQSRMQGETSAAIDVWDEISSGIYRPKDENSLSDYIKRHLEQDLAARGIVSSREVEIRRKRGNAPGERTDIHITGVAGNASADRLDQWRVIVEVKGEWHQGVLTAMETQLQDRYLKDNTCSHGIYVVGWYRCPQWDAEDSRHDRLPIGSCEELALTLGKQAERLSNDTQRIDAFVLNASLR